MQFRKFHLVCTLAILMVLSQCRVEAEEMITAPQIASESQPESPDGDFDHEDISSGLLDAVDRVDDFFGVDRVDEEASRTRLRARGGAEYFSRGEWGFRQRINLQLHLPRIARTTKIILGNVFAGDENDVPFLSQDDNRNNASIGGLRHFFLEDGPSRVSIDGGLRWRSGLAPFTQLRGRYRTDFQNWVITPVQLLFYERRDEELGETTRLYLDRVVTDSSLFRILLEGTFSQRSHEEGEGLNFSYGFSWLSDIDAERGYALELVSHGETGPSPHLVRVEARTTYRQLIWGKWLYAQGGPVAKFEDDDDWRTNYGAFFELEALFGDLSRPLRFWKPN